MNIKIHRIYDSDVPQGYHVLVDRLWPRGISKDQADLDGDGVQDPGELREKPAHGREEHGMVSEKSTSASLVKIKKRQKNISQE